MINSAQMREVAVAAGWDVIEARLPESLPVKDIAGIPRVDVKALVEQARRRQAQETLLYGEGDA